MPGVFGAGSGLAEKISKAAAEFSTMAARQSTITPDTTWLQFGATRPGIVPAGTDQSTKDMRVYENVVAIVESGGKHGQLQIGTLVQVGDVWRVIDMPQPMIDGQADDHWLTAERDLLTQPVKAKKTRAPAVKAARKPVEAKLASMTPKVGKPRAKTSSARQDSGVSA